MKRAYRVAASILTGLTLGLGILCARVRWEPHVDFDVTGLLWLMQNVVPLTLAVITVGVAGMAIRCWLQVIRRG